MTHKSNLYGFLLALTFGVASTWKIFPSALPLQYNIHGVRYQNIHMATAVDEDLVVGNSDRLLASSATFVEAWKEAIKGKSDSLKQIVSGESKWDNPMVSTMKDLLQGMQQFSNFFEDPCLSVFEMKKIGENQVDITYQLSFWYPLPWRPRVIIPGRAMVSFSRDFTTVTSVEEAWDVNLVDVFIKQVLPRWWDVWHLFSSPSPEYPPIRQIGKSGKVSFVELPQTVSCEVRWSGLAKYPGPPLVVSPGFSLFGNLRTSLPKRDKFYTVLPIEVQSGTFVCPDTQRKMKQSSWMYHVPTVLQEQVIEKARTENIFPIIETTEDDESIDAEGDEGMVKADFVVGLENINVMKSITRGAQRGENFIVNSDELNEFQSNEKKVYQYKILPKRIVAQVDVKGEVLPDKISAALKLIREAVAVDGEKIIGSQVRLRPRDLLCSDASKLPKEYPPLLGLQLHFAKACLNEKAEPAMAVYEMQYGGRLTKIQVELEIV